MDHGLQEVAHEIGRRVAQNFGKHGGRVENLDRERAVDGETVDDWCCCSGCGESAVRGSRAPNGDLGLRIVLRERARPYRSRSPRDCSLCRSSMLTVLRRSHHSTKPPNMTAR